MQEDGVGLDLGVEGVFVEKHCAPSIMTNMKPFHNSTVVNVLSCLLQRNDMQLACDLFHESVCVSSSRSWVPIVDTETFLFGSTSVCTSANLVHR